MTRSFWVWLHRWVGLAMTGFLVIVGLTGSLLAFQEEIDHWLNPDLLNAAPSAAPLLDSFALREQAEATDSRITVDHAPIWLAPNASAFFVPTPRIDPATGAPFDLGYTEFFLDPYTGRKLGQRKWGEASLARQDIVSFLYRLHYSLALPAAAGVLGNYVLGVIALAWSLDCFVAFYLTLPRMKNRSWWKKWRAAWKIERVNGTYRLNFDIHRAFGLWIWPMLFVFAWSSVGFNLHEVYQPVMRAAFGLTAPGFEAPSRLHPLDHPRLDWRPAYAAAHKALEQSAREQRFTIEHEGNLVYDRDRGVYVLYARSSLDMARNWQTSVVIDAETGVLRNLSLPRKSAESWREFLDRWLFAVHMARPLGLPMQALVCVIGLMITTLSLTGVYIWWRKRSARRRRSATGAIERTRELAC